MLPDYAELHCLSNFSFLRGASHAEELVVRAQSLGYRALAITDECSLAGIVRAHGAAKEHGLHLIVGSEFTLDDGLRLVLLAPNREAYADLSELITTGRRQATKGEYQLSRDEIVRFSRHLLRSGCRQRIRAWMMRRGCAGPLPIAPGSRWNC